MKRLIFALLCTVFLVSCQSTGVITPPQVRGLHAGMTKSEVVRTVGEPHRVHRTVNQSGVQTAFSYRERLQANPGNPNGVLFLYFRQDTLRTIQ